MAKSIETCELFIDDNGNLSLKTPKGEVVDTTNIEVKQSHDTLNNGFALVNVGLIVNVIKE